MRLQVLMISLLAADFAGAEPVVSESALRASKPAPVAPALDLTKKSCYSELL